MSLAKRAARVHEALAVKLITNGCSIAMSAICVSPQRGEADT